MKLKTGQVFYSTHYKTYLTILSQLDSGLGGFLAKLNHSGPMHNLMVWDNTFKDHWSTHKLDIFNTFKNLMERNEA